MSRRFEREQTSSHRCRIVFADDHFLIRQGLRSILRERENLEVIGEAKDGMELLFLLDTLNPDLVILDISMPNLQGIETIPLIKMRHPEINILILTMHQEREYVIAAVSAGVDGYILKEDAPNDLLTAVERVCQGKGFISPILSKIIGESNKLLGETLKFALDC